MRLLVLSVGGPHPVSFKESNSSIFIVVHEYTPWSGGRTWWKTYVVRTPYRTNISWMHVTLFISGPNQNWLNMHAYSFVCSILILHAHSLACTFLLLSVQCKLVVSLVIIETKFIASSDEITVTSVATEHVVVSLGSLRRSSVFLCLQVGSF